MRTPSPWTSPPSSSCAPTGRHRCLTQRHAGQLPEVARTVQQVLAGLDLPGPINEQRFSDDHSDEVGALNALYLGADLRGRADLDVVRQDVAQLAVSWRCDEGPYPSNDELSIATLELTTWLRDRPAPPYDGVLAGRSEQEALALVKAVSAPARRCDEAAVRALLATRS